MNLDAIISYPEILQGLEQLHRDQRTGTARVTTSENQLLQLGFDNGEIVGVTFGSKHNLEAIKLFAVTCRTGRLIFSEGRARALADGELPSTAAILRRLGLTDALAASAPTPTVMPAAVMITVIEREAIEFLGPMASIIWAEQLAKIGGLAKPGALQKLTEALAREIGKTGDAAKAQLFRTNVAKKLASSK